MAENFSFDVVSDFDKQELVNALDQVKREISQRYDLKGTETSVDLEKEHIFIPKNTIHRIENIGEEELIFIEIQLGENLEEDDIIRLEDDYGRV